MIRFMHRGTLAAAVALGVAMGCSGGDDAGGTTGEGAMEKAGKAVDDAAASLRSDLDAAYLHARSRAALLDGIGADALSIDIDVENDGVVLKGTVAKADSKARATELVKAVDGVESVDNRLVHDPAAKSEPKAMEKAKSEVADLVLHSKVRLSLLDELGTDGLAVDIDVDAGKVVLTGVLPESKHALALEAAKSVGGVEAVEEHLVPRES
jgi:hyperosmotically inducible protein